MNSNRYHVWLLFLVVGLYQMSTRGMFPNLTRNDPLPLFSSVYPYSFLATRQKAALMRFDYSFVQPRFRFSLSGYRQYANRARNSERDVINIGDINGRLNMFGPFYDPKLRNLLYQALDLKNNAGATVPVPPEVCQNFIQDPRYSDPNNEFGFFSVPILYRKYGVRFESELLLIDSCFHALGIMVQWGINDVRQTVTDFEDFTCQALGKACPANSVRGVVADCAEPEPVIPTAVAPPFIDPITVPPCPQPACNPTGRKDCVTELQPFKPCCDQKVCLSFTGECKQFVIENIMNQKDLIAKILNLDLCNYHKTGLDDLRISMYWRYLSVINEDDERYPRALFMPFVQAGVGIPTMEETDNRRLFAVPNGNNGHPFVGGRAGFTIDFLDTIDISFSGGFSYFFKRDYCNLPLPTNAAESGIFPYSADVSLRPGPTWNFNFGMHAYHFLDNLSFWVEYAIVSHTKDRIEVCQSYIPEGSDYFESGFDIDRAECFSKWEAHMVNVGFNYDLLDCISLGFLWQAPAKQRNAYRSGTILGTLTFVY